MVIVNNNQKDRVLNNTNNVVTFNIELEHLDVRDFKTLKGYAYSIVDDHLRITLPERGFDILYK